MEIARGHGGEEASVKEKRNPAEPLPSRGACILSMRGCRERKSLRMVLVALVESAAGVHCQNNVDEFFLLVELGDLITSRLGPLGYEQID